MSGSEDEEEDVQVKIVVVGNGASGKVYYCITLIDSYCHTLYLVGNILVA